MWVKANLPLWTSHRSGKYQVCSKVISAPQSAFWSAYILYGFPNVCWRMELNPICRSDNPNWAQTFKRESWDTMFCIELLNSKPSHSHLMEMGLTLLCTRCTVIILCIWKELMEIHTCTHRLSPIKTCSSKVEKHLEMHCYTLCHKILHWS